MYYFCIKILAIFFSYRHFALKYRKDFSSYVTP